MDQGSSKTGIPSRKIPVNIARRNRYLDSHCVLTLMIPELMQRLYVVKKSL